MVTHQSEDLPSDINDALTSVGIVGFNPVTDAIKDTRIGRIYYVKNNEIRWAAPPHRHQQTWMTPGTMKPKDFEKALNDADEDDIAIIDKTVFNQLVSGPLTDIKRIHDGLAWGITVMCEHKLQRGEKPSWKAVEAVQGMGETLTGEFMRNFDAYTTPDLPNTEPNAETQSTT